MTEQGLTRAQATLWRFVGSDVWSSGKEPRPTQSISPPTESARFIKTEEARAVLQNIEDMARSALEDGFPSTLILESIRDEAQEERAALDD